MDHDAIAAYEAAYPIHVRMAWRDRFDPARHPEAAIAFRRTVEVLGIPAHCHRSRCRRAKRCLTPKVDCGFVHAASIEVEIVPKLTKALRQLDKERALPSPARGRRWPPRQRRSIDKSAVADLRRDEGSRGEK